MRQTIAHRDLHSASAFRRLVGAAILIACCAAPASAQLPQTRLFSVFPCGGKTGSTFELTLSSGVDLDEADRLLFNHPGLSAVVKTKQVGDRKEPVPGTFLVTIAPDVPTGVYEVYAGGLFGLSNPRTFAVGSQPEGIEAEPNDEPDKANSLELNKTINGAIARATDVDFFRFEGKRGQRVIATCRAADLDSHLSAVLEILGPDGRHLGFSREQMRHDPMLDVVLPADGKYLVKVRDFQFRGGPEYAYRLSVGTAPHLDYIMPPAGVAGTTSKHTLFGRLLPGGKPSGVKVNGVTLDRLDVDVALPDRAPVAPAHTTLRSVDAGVETVSYVLKSPAGDSNPVLIELAPAAPVVEREPNDSPANAQVISAPGEFVGQFQAPGDTDYVTFDAQKGQAFSIDLFAERLGSLADPYLVLQQVVRKPGGGESVTQMTSADDDNANIAPNLFDTRTDDPIVRFEAPETGTYRIVLRDRSFESRGDPAMVYRLSIRREQPDFSVVALPRYPLQGTVTGTSTWPIGLRKGDSRDLQLLVIRRDGFREPIEISVEGLPQGVSCPAQTIAPGLKTTELIFTATENAPEWAGFIHVVAKARVSDSSKMAALGAAERAEKKAADVLKNAQTFSEKSAQASKKADELLAIVTALSAASSNDGIPKDAKTTKLIETVAKAAASAAELARSAPEKLAAAKKSVEQAGAARQVALRDSAPREVVHEAIPGSIVWNATAKDTPVVSRVGQSLALSVMKEPAPFQVSSDVSRVEANQSRQILIPLALAKRNGFDADVAITLVGLPDGSNIDVKPKPIPHGKKGDVVRLFAAKNARLGTFTLYWKAQAPVSYKRNPLAEERAKAAQAQAVQAVAAATAELKKSAVDRDAAVKAHQAALAARDAAKVNLAQALKAAAAISIIQVVEDEKHKVPAVSPELIATAQVAAKIADLAEKSAAESAAAAKDASKDAKIEAAANAATAAKAAMQARNAANTAAAAAGMRHPLEKQIDRAALEKRIDDLQGNAKKLSDASSVAARSLADLEIALVAAEKARRQAEAAAKLAEARSQAAAAAKTAADQKAEQAVKAAAPQTLNEFALSTPVTLTIKRAPATITASVAKGGTLKKGARLAINVNVRRNSAFKGPVRVSLPMPRDVSGVQAEPVTIPADKSQAVLTVIAGPSATQGQIANLVVRAEMDFQGAAAIDAPVAINVVP